MTVPDPDSRADDGAPTSSAPRSMAAQISQALMVASLVGAVVVTGGWWVVADHAKTSTTVLLALLATIALWVVIYRLLVYGIKRMVRSRIAARQP